MATTEERVDKLEVRFSTLEQQVATVAAKVDSLIEESKQQREDNRRAQEKHDADLKTIQAKQDADRKALEDKIDRLGDKIQNMVIAAAAVSTLK